LGRWLSRDPIAEEGGIRLYGYVGDSPIDAVDPFGLWSDHGALTRQSFDALDLATTDRCKKRILKRLVGANEDQDSLFGHGSIFGPGWDHRRHFNRASTQKPGDARREYNEYLEYEEREFRKYVRGATRSDCKKALDALGRLTHSWQDFFAHAYHETLGWNVWNNDVAGTPDSPGALYPSSWPGEHPLGAEPISPGHADYDFRRRAADMYVRGRLGPLLNAWLDNAKCKCFCEKSWWF
jgi:hypothetical protein